MTSEAVFIQVGALADGFAPHGNLLATASLPAGENFTFYVAGSEPQQLVIEDEQTLSWNGKRAPWRATALRPDILFIDFLDPERDNASISAVCNLTQRNATLVYGQLPDEAAARLDAFSRVEQGLPLTAVETRFVFARLDAQPGPLPGFTTALVGIAISTPIARPSAMSTSISTTIFTPGSVWTAWKRGWRMSIAATMCRWLRISICSSGGRKSFPRWG